MCFSNDGKYIFSSVDIYIFQWCIADYSNVQSFCGHDYYRSVKCITISSDDKYLYSGSSDKSIIQWNVDDASINQRCTYDSEILSIALSPDDQTLVAGSEDCKVLVWAVSDDSFKMSRILSGHSNEVRGVAVSPDG